MRAYAEYLQIKLSAFLNTLTRIADASHEEDGAAGVVADHEEEGVVGPHGGDTGADTGCRYDDGGRSRGFGALFIYINIGFVNGRVIFVNKNPRTNAVVAHCQQFTQAVKKHLQIKMK